MFGNGYNGFYPYSNLGAGMMSNIGNGLGGLGYGMRGMNAASGLGGMARGSGGLLSGLAGGMRGAGALGRFSWSGLLTGTQKTLNVVNQAIPVFYQVKPMWNNAKTVFRIFGAIKDDDKETTTTNSKSTKTSTSVSNNISNKASTTNNDGPNFFL